VRPRSAKDSSRWFHRDRRHSGDVGYNLWTGESELYGRPVASRHPSAGVTAWNSWREQHPSIRPDLSEAGISQLTRRNLSEGREPPETPYLPSLTGVGVLVVSRMGANLTGADLSGMDLSLSNLTGANLTGANLRNSIFVKTNLEEATLDGCSVYGINAWSLKLEGTEQQNLDVSDYGEPAIRVDNLEVAQFIHLLLNNERIRQVIDTITSKVVLILGRFASERKAVLEALRESLRQHDYLPVLFDFDKPTGRDLTESISTLAHMARFIIADITEAKSIPQELQAIVPNLPSVPAQPLLLASEYEYGMFEHFKRYPWVLEVYRYNDPNEVLTSLEGKIISPAETKARELSQ